MQLCLEKSGYDGSISLDSTITSASRTDSEGAYGGDEMTDGISDTDDRSRRDSDCADDAKTTPKIITGHKRKPSHANKTTRIHPLASLKASIMARFTKLPPLRSRYSTKVRLPRKCGRSCSRTLPRLPPLPPPPPPPPSPPGLPYSTKLGVGTPGKAGRAALTTEAGTMTLTETDVVSADNTVASGSGKEYQKVADTIPVRSQTCGASGGGEIKDSKTRVDAKSSYCEAEVKKNMTKQAKTRSRCGTCNLPTRGFSKFWRRILRKKVCRCKTESTSCGRC